jgi:hypothetical protein
MNLKVLQDAKAELVAEREAIVARYTQGIEALELVIVGRLDRAVSLTDRQAENLVDAAMSRRAAGKPARGTTVRRTGTKAGAKWNRKGSELLEAIKTLAVRHGARGFTKEEMEAGVKTAGIRDVTKVRMCLQNLASRGWLRTEGKYGARRYYAAVPAAEVRSSKSEVRSERAGPPAEFPRRGGQAPGPFAMALEGVVNGFGRPFTTREAMEAMEKAFPKMSETQRFSVSTRLGKMEELGRLRRSGKGKATTWATGVGANAPAGARATKVESAYNVFRETIAVPRDADAGHTGYEGGSDHEGAGDQ